MVGSPKSLLDLRKIDASVRVTCNACGRARDLDREELIATLARRGRNLAWQLIAIYFHCSADGCGSKDVRILPVPFAASAGGGEALVARLVEAADKLVLTLSVTTNAAPELLAMATARKNFEDAKRALLAWVWKTKT